MNILHLIVRDENYPWIAASIVRVDGDEMIQDDVDYIREKWNEFNSSREVEDGEYQLHEFVDWMDDNDSFSEYQESLDEHISMTVEG